MATIITPTGTLTPTAVDQSMYDRGVRAGTVVHDLLEGATAVTPRTATAQSGTVSAVFPTHAAALDALTKLRSAAIFTLQVPERPALGYRFVIPAGEEVTASPIEAGAWTLMFRVRVVS